MQELANHVKFGCSPAIVCQGQVQSNVAGKFVAYNATLCVCDRQFMRSSSSGVCLPQPDPICGIGSYSVNYIGGEISYPPPTGADGVHVYHEFRHNGVGSSTTMSLEVTDDIKSAEVLIIGGGGSGGSSNGQSRGGGGGGAGRLLWLSQVDISAGKKTVVGVGGTSPGTGWIDTRGGNGFDSILLGLRAVGGGGGGGAQPNSGYMHGNRGGSGGGGGDWDGNGGAASGANTATSFGNKGGTADAHRNNGGAGAGGGGAGGNGHNAQHSG